MHPIERWAPGAVIEATAIGMSLLTDVGMGESYVKRGIMVLHVRRSLSVEEIAGLSPAWVALPAIDRAG